MNETTPGNRMSEAAKRRPSTGAGLDIHSPIDTPASSVAAPVVASPEDLTHLLGKLRPHHRIAIDTEADSLHCYREKLCLLQLSIPSADFVLDPLALQELQSLAAILREKEIVLHGADFDLRLLRRSIDLLPERIFDTVIAARLLGQRQFSLAALVQRYFDVELPKGSQKANWARRPLPRRMLAYAVNDTHYLLSLAELMEAELAERGRLDWFHQSCQRAIEQAAIERTRDPDEVWRISGSGALRGRAAAILRELWHWREEEARAADKPAFHILQNEELVRAATGFQAGENPDYRHFSVRRRSTFRAAAERGLQLEESQWPAPRRRFGTRRSSEANRRVDELRARRDRVANELQLEPSFVAPRATLEAVAVDENRANELLVPWQREVLRLAEPAASF